MSVYRPATSPYYHFDFQHQGRRFHGSTGCVSKRDAQRFEAAKRRSIALGEDAKPSVSLGDACDQWWLAKGQHLKQADDEFRRLKYLMRGLGKTTPLQDITVRTLDAYIAKRRYQRTNATVNRDIELLRRVIRWIGDRKIDVPDIKWGAVILPEPSARHHELTVDEEARLFAALPDNLKPLVEFALLSGLRLTEIVTLTWRQLDLPAARLFVVGKGDKPHTVYLTARMVALLANQPKVCPQVFTYECQRPGPRRKDRPARAKGERYPFSRQGWKRQWAAAIEQAGLSGFRFHDLRHTFASRTLRATGNLAVVRDMLAHSDIATTTRYARALETDMRAAMEKTQRANDA